MATLIKIKNAFEPWNGREVIMLKPGMTVADVRAQYANLPCEMDLLVNSLPASDHTVIQELDFVSISPVIAGGGGGKNILATIAMVAISVASGLAGAAFATEAGAWTVGSYIASAAVMIVGSTLIQRFCSTTPASVDFGKYSYDNDPTYSWGGVQTMEGQNNGIALTYGKILSAGQTIGKYIDVSDNKEYLNWLIACGEGPLKISDIKLNDNEVSYYSGVTVETREGLNDQEIISNFNDTYFTKALGYELTSTERIDTCQGNATEGIRVKLTFQNGLYYANDEGGLSSAWVDIVGWLRNGNGGEWIPFLYNATYSESTIRPVDSNRTPFLVGAFGISYNPQQPINYSHNSGASTVDFDVKLIYPNGTQKTGVLRGTKHVDAKRVYDKDGYYDHTIYTVWWTVSGDVADLRFSGTDIRVTSYTIGAAGIRISGAQNSALRREFKIDNLAPGTYQVKLQVAGRSHGTTNSRAAVRVWWSELTSVVYDDFSYPNIALIGIKALATDQISGTPALSFIKERESVLVWNPYTNAYEEMLANNPAWAAYDCIHQCAKLKNIATGAWEYEVRGVPARYMIYDQFKEWADFCLEKKLEINIEITVMGEMLEVVNKRIANVGRGLVLRYGTRYGCTWDCAKAPVQMFGMGNIIAGTFAEEFLQTSDRANCVEVTYMDRDADYARETITIYSEDYDLQATEKTAQATYDGITSYEQAYREGMYQLYSNKYILRTVSFEAGIDAIACSIGDVILVAHDVPKWARSGRIYKVEGQELVLPVELDETLSQYRIMYRTVNDNMYSSNVEILSNGNGWCRVLVESPFNDDDMPQVNDIFDLAVANIGSKPFVVKSISRAQDFTRKIECIEYNENVYNENYHIPPIQYSSGFSKLKDVSDLRASKFLYHDAAGNALYRIGISWNRESQGRFVISLSADGDFWELVSRDATGEWYNAESYIEPKFVKVITSEGLRQTKGVIAEVSDLDILIPPTDVLGFEVVQTGTKLVAKIEEIHDIDLDHYELRQGSSWTRSRLIGTFTGASYSWDAVDEGTLTFWLKAVDTSGVESEKAAKSICNVLGLPVRNIVYEHDIPDSLWVTTSMVKNSNGYWRIRARKLLQDYDLFADIFGQKPLLMDDAQILLPAVDLGENIIDTSVFWRDSNGKYHLKSKERLGDFALFADIFQHNYTYEKAKYQMSTFLNIKVESYTDGDGRYTIEYRTSIDGENWSEWLPENEKQFAGRFVQVRVRAESLDGVSNVYIRKIVVVIDVPDIEEIIENVRISGTTTIEYNKRTFTEIKSISCYTQIKGVQATCWIERQGLSSADISILNELGARTDGLLQKMVVRGF